MCYRRLVLKKKQVNVILEISFTFRMMNISDAVQSLFFPGNSARVRRQSSGRRVHRNEPQFISRNFFHSPIYVNIRRLQYGARFFEVAVLHRCEQGCNKNGRVKSREIKTRRRGAREGGSSGKF